MWFIYHEVWEAQHILYKVYIYIYPPSPSPTIIQEAGLDSVVSRLVCSPTPTCSFINSQFLHSQSESELASALTMKAFHFLVAGQVPLPPVILRCMCGREAGRLKQRGVWCRVELGTDHRGWRAAAPGRWDRCPSPPQCEWHSDRWPGSWPPQSPCPCF